MEKNFITKEQKEKVSNRLVLNFAVLLVGALAMLYVYNFASAGYPLQVKNVLGVLGIVFLVLGILMVVLGYLKCPKLKRYSAIPFASIVPCALVSYFHKVPFLTKKYPGFAIENAVVITFILMALYFIVLAIYTAIYLAKHPVLSDKKKIQHKKKK